MIKMLELIGFALIGGTVYAFIGPIPRQDPVGWPIFWACAIGTLAIIIYRKKLKKNEELSEK